jgi:hypothetical protein
MGALLDRDVLLWIVVCALAIGAVLLALLVTVQVRADPSGDDDSGD